jgi:hypothetical protein
MEAFMSIMPEGGWDAPREGQIVPSQSEPRPPVVIIQHESKSSAFNIGFTSCPGVICAVIFTLFCLGILVRVLTSVPSQSTFQKANVGNITSKAWSYSVSEIDADKNSIPTGAELAVIGTVYMPRWGPTDECTLLLAGRQINVQHGEADPADYCRFSILLTEKNKHGEDTWPGASLMCDMSPQEMQEDTRLYHYGEKVRARGTYAASLDFDVADVPGFHFGVPVLNNCTIEGPADGADQIQ